MKLMATPKTIWSPGWVIEAKTVHQREKHGGGYGGAQAEPGRASKTAAAEAPAKVPASILPSSPVSKTPARSE